MRQVSQKQYLVLLFYLFPFALSLGWGSALNEGTRHGATTPAHNCAKSCL